MPKHQFLSLVILVALALILGVPAAAQDTQTPSVTVADQVILDKKVFINSAYSAGPGFIVIHSEDPTGGPGPVIGFESITQGWTYNLWVKIDPAQATSTLYAMLHVDDNTIGTYEFGTVGGADAPVSVDGQVVTPAFRAEVIHVHDQFVQNNQVVIDSVTTQQSGFVVIHSGDPEAFGGTIGFAPVPAGTTTNVVVDLAAEGQTPVLWPMLHVDTGAVGTYEFGTVEGADPPVIVGTTMATTPIWTVPHLRVNNQKALPGDGQPAHATAYTVTVASVLSEGPGFVVIHQDENGTFGPVAGFLNVPAGHSEDLVIELNPERVTYQLWPMLHQDTGQAGVYEFGQVEGADPPVVLNGEVLTFPITAGPALVLEDQEPQVGSSADKIVITIKEAVIDRPGWIAIHSNDNGNPGPVLGVALLHDYSNQNVTVEIDAAAAGNLVHPMLHYDTGTLGVYEFGTVEGADPPVLVGGNVIVAPLNLTGAAAPPTGTEVCTVSPGYDANLHSGPSTDAAQTGTLAAGQTATVTAQTIGADGYVWYQLEDGSFVRSDVVTTAGVCGDLPGADVTAPPPPTVTSEAVATPTPAVAEPTTPPDTGGGEVVTVEIQDFQFSPNNITIPVGTTVRFVSVGQVQHTVTSDSGLFDSGILTNGQEFSFTFTEAGTFPYFCQLHGAAGGGGMAGTIVVEAAPSSGTSGEPVTVEIQDFQFAPNSITVPVGTTVRFVSVGQVQHTVTSDSGLYDSGILTNGQEFSFTFTEAGTFPYFCQLHGAAGGGGMAGTVIVQ